MIHARKDYDHIQDKTGKIGEDEPVMVFRAKDKLAPIVLIQYAKLLEASGCDPHMILAVLDQAGKMFDWQKKYGTKFPDMPKEAVRE